MSVFSILKEDHQKVAKLLDEACQTTERAAKGRKELINKIKQELDLHTQLEETIFYPPLKGIKETHDLILEAYAEHENIERLIKVVRSEETDHEEWLANLKVLKENIEHHVKEEENTLFPKVKEVLKKEELERMAAAMKLFKEQHYKKAA